jgi:protocatechuate 3,4-dioxygenase beta subunit
MNCRRLFSLVLLLAALPSLCQQQAQSTGRKFEVTGRVVNALTGEVLRKASVQLIPTTDRAQPLHYEVTDGSFEFHGLEAGKYTLVGQAPHFLQQSFEQHENFNTAIAVGPEKTSTGIIFRLRPEGAIAGRILDEHNEAVRDAQVLLFERSTDTGKRLVERRSQTMSDDQGEYSFNHLHAGMYYIVVAAQPWYRSYLQQTNMRNRGSSPSTADVDPALDSAYPITYYPGTSDAENAGALVVHPGDRLSADFNLTPVPSLHVKFLNTHAEMGRPIQPNLRARVFGNSWVFVQQTMTWQQNEMEMSGIAPGDYSLNVRQRDGAENRTSGQEISLRGDTELDATAVASLEQVHGIIKFDGTRAPSNAFLQFRDVNARGGMGTRPDEHGEFKVQPQHAGRYVVSLGNAPGYAIRNISATGARVSGRTIEITGAEAVELTIAASEGVAQIEGTVINGDKPLSGTMVVLAPQEMADNTSLFRRDQSDSDGTFTLRDVVPGRYTALAIQNGWDLEWASPESLRPYLAKGTPVVVSGKEKLEIKIAAQ